MTRFSDQVVVLTGASEGIGKEAALGFAREGAKVVLAARRPEPLDALAAEIGEAALAVPTDVSDLEGCRALLLRAAEHFGGVDVLVNNAGAHFRGPVESRSAQELATMIDVNTRGPIVLSRLVLDHFRARGGRGTIVNVASLAGMTPLPDAATYSASKFALRAFSIALGEELQGTEMRVALVSPGPIIDTGFLMDSLEEAADVVFSQPMSTAREIAELILDSAADGARERSKPRSGAVLATLSYLVPGLRRRLRPVLEARGRRMKERYRRQRAEG
jgi:NADP-dependent 3-hydroxy acid dehydrogenase YdfG